MKSFKLKNKDEEKKMLEQQKRDTEIASKNENLNVVQKNPQTTGALILGIIAILIMFIPNGGFVSIILVIFAARRLSKAKKIGENKKYINVSYAIVYLPVIVWLFGSLAFAFSATR